MNIASKIIEKPSLTRRDFVAGMATATIAFGSLPAFGAEKLKVVGFYTQPIQQKWDARLHLALDAAAKRGEIEYSFAEKVSKFVDKNGCNSEFGAVRSSADLLDLEKC